MDDPELSSAISEAVAEALDPPTEEKVAKAPAKKKAAAAKKDATAKKAAAKKAAATRQAARRRRRPRRRAAKKAADEEGRRQEGRGQEGGGQEGGAGDEAGPGQEIDGQEGRPTLVAADQSEPRRRTATPPPAVNAPLSFITFVATYPVGTTVEGEVVSFTSHGAMVDVALPDGGSLHCYIPLSAMGDPPPTKARQVLTKGEVRPFVLSSLDPPRRVAELVAARAPGEEAAEPGQEGGRGRPLSGVDR